jgi:hypothetical protein
MPTHRIYWCAAFLAALAILFPTIGNSEKKTPSASRVADALQNISALSRPGRVGYATAWDGNKYIQCRRQTDSSMRCEAAGTTMQPSLKSVLDGARLNRLAALGWVLDPSFGNYVRTFPAETPIPQIAERIVQIERGLCRKSRRTGDRNTMGRRPALPAPQWLYAKPRRHDQ